MGNSGSGPVCEQEDIKGTQYFSMDLSDAKASGGDCQMWNGQWALDMSFHPLNLIQLVLDRLVKWRGELIIVMPWWSNQSWFPKIMRLAIEPPRRLQASEWLLWNATIGMANPTVMRKYQADWLEAPITVFSRNWIPEETARKITVS